MDNSIFLPNGEDLIKDQPLLNKTIKKLNGHMKQQSFTQITVPFSLSSKYSVKKAIQTQNQQNGEEKRQNDLNSDSETEMGGDSKKEQEKQNNAQESDNNQKSFEKQYEDEDLVKIYLYQVTSFDFLIITPKKIGEIDKIAVKYPKTQEIYYLECKFIEEQEVEIYKFNQIFLYNKYIISLILKLPYTQIPEQFIKLEEILQFHNEKTQEKHKEYSRSNMLIVPIYDSSIGDSNIQFDFMEMQTLVDHMENQDPIKEEESMGFKVQNMEEKEKYAFLENNMFEGTNQNRIVYSVYDVVEKPMEESAFEFIQKLQKLLKDQHNMFEAYGVSEEEAKQMSVDKLLYEHQFEELNEAKKHENIKSLRKNWEEFQNTDRKAGIAFCRYQNPIQRIDYSPYNHISNENLYFPSLRKFPPFDTNTFQFVRINTLRVYPLSLSKINEYTFIPTIFLQIERRQLANQLADSLMIEADNCDMMDSTSTTQYDIHHNYENLETVGDALLKYLSSCHIYQIYENQNKNEGFYTNVRRLIIKNNFLGIQSYKLGIQYYISNQHRKVKDFRFPLVHLPESIKYSQCKLGASSNLADVLEAIFGASLVHKYNLWESYMIIERCLEIDLSGSLKKKTENNDWDPQQQQQQNDRIEEQTDRKNKLLTKNILMDFTMHEKISFSGEESFMDLFQHIGFSEVQQYKCKFFIDMLQEMTPEIQKNHLNLSYFEDLEQRIGYSFKNKKYIIEAFNFRPLLGSYSKIYKKSFQELEFLGDSIIEVLVVANTYYFWKKREKKQISKGRNKSQEIDSEEGKIQGQISQNNEYFSQNLQPGILSKFKLWLLSNNFLGKLSCVMGLPNYLLNISDSEQNNLKEYFEDVQNYMNKKDKIINYSRHSFKTHKLAGDLVESLCGALILDGGWKALIKVFGPVFSIFIKFLTEFEDQLVSNIEEQLVQEYKCTFSCEMINCEQEKEQGQDMQQGVNMYICKCKNSSGEEIGQGYGYTEGQAIENAGYMGLKLLKKIEDDNSSQQ